MSLHKVVPTKDSRIVLGIFLLSIAGLITLWVVDHLVSIKASYHLYQSILDFLVVLNSISLFGVIYTYKKSILIALAIALIWPAFYFMSAGIADYIDMYHAGRDPDSFYYKQ